ncbi:MAG TPA: N-acetylmuramoyl-L-alanine amidase [Anaerolineae bacterium]|nr:N-acetylmuramoyl-L-alanine amidase [Anaerolineae bacterium]
MRLEPVTRLQYLFRLIVLLLLLAAAFLLARTAWEQGLFDRWLRGGDPTVPRQQPVPSVKGKRVGIVAGHWGFDVGATCPDGLTEVSVNQTIARLTAERLRRAGAQVDLMGEFDERLPGYRADAFLSIHADSCLEGVSGFKAARAVNSAVPEAEDRLLRCVYDRYAKATGLQPHPGSITHDMLEYHAFRVMDPTTPAVIVETGFLGGDRELLVKHPYRVAWGLAEGMLCFLTASSTPE